MKERKLYYSRKRGKIIIEGIQTKHDKKNTIHIVTLPKPIELLKSYFLIGNKSEKIAIKLGRVDYKEEKTKKGGQKFVQ